MGLLKDLGADHDEITTRLQARFPDQNGFRLCHYAGVLAAMVVSSLGFYKSDS